MGQESFGCKISGFKIKTIKQFVNCTHVVKLDNSTFNSCQDNFFFEFLIHLQLTMIFIVNLIRGVWNITHLLGQSALTSYIAINSSDKEVKP